MARSLLVTINLPFPTRSGPDLRAWQMANSLRATGPTAVFGVVPRPEDGPEPSGFEVWRAAGDPELAARWASGAALSGAAAGSPEAPYYSAGAEAELEAVIEEFRPEVVVLDQVWLAGYLPAARRDARRVVLNTHNVEADLQQDLAGAEQSRPARMVRTLFARRVADLEGATMRQVDAVWACSAEDARRIEERFAPPVAVSVVPNTIDAEAYTSEAVSALPLPEGLAYGPHTVVFPAQFSYPPNQAAAQVLLDQVFPSLAARHPDAGLLLVGRSPTPQMLQAASGDRRIVVTGGVEEVRPFLHAASVMAVPLKVGSGTRFKILEAFASGVPVISTPVGAEGLAVIEDTHLLLAESVDDFVEAIARLWEDGKLAARLTAGALSLVRERYSWRASEAAVAASFAALGLDAPV